MTAAPKFRISMVQKTVTLRDPSSLGSMTGQPGTLDTAGRIR